jgi:hypothetical protein
MTMATIHEVLRAHLSEWLKAKNDRKRRGEITKLVSSAVRIHPKSVSRAFQRLQMEDEGAKKRCGRPRMYTFDVLAALKDVWEAADRCCGELLHPVIPDYVDALKRFGSWTHGEEATKRLLRMSLGTVKRYALGFQKKHGTRRGIASTKPSALKTLIPIFKGPWTGLPPGNGQVDTLAHCGDTLIGDFIFTVNYTDAATYWALFRAQWNKGQRATWESLTVIRERLPFKMLGLHPDSGSEFINWSLFAWCEKEGIFLSRSEPGKKNDNMYVEERNGHVVRKQLGYLRFDIPELVPVMNAFYDVLELYLNHWKAVRRQISKVRVGAKYVRKYEVTAKTPYQRVLEHKDVPEDVKRRLREEHASMNPLKLKKELDTLKSRIYKLQRAARERKGDLSRFR